MENIIFNELIAREFDVDVGMVEYHKADDRGILYIGIEEFLLDEASLDL